MNAALRIAGKDLRQRIRDRSALMLAIVLPLTLAFIYSLIFGPASTPRPFRYAVVDLDRGAVSQVFTGQVLDEIAKQGVVTVRRVGSVAEAERLTRAGTVDAAFVLPAGFTAAVQGGAAARVEVIGNVDAPTGTAVARSIAESYATALASARLAVATVASAPGHQGLTPAQLAALAERAAALAAPVAIRDVSAKKKVLPVKTYFAAGMAVFFLFFTVQFGVTSLLDERNEGTLGRLLAAPIPPAAILLGKLLTSVVLGVVSMTVLVTATAVLMGVAWGNPAGVALLVLAGVLAATGITALVASLAHDPEQAGNWQAVIAVILGLLGGVFFPISQVGGIMTTLSLVTPHAWFMRGLGELAGGGGAGSVLPAVAAMLLFAAATGSIALLRLSKAVRP